jgi:hypothetical protein
MVEFWWVVPLLVLIGLAVRRRAVLGPVVRILRTGQLSRVAAIEGVRVRAKGGTEALDVLEAERTPTGDRIVVQHPSGDRYEFTITVR